MFIMLYKLGKMARDFAYIDDIIEGVVKVLDNPDKCNHNWDPQKPDPATSPAPCKVYNIGNNNPVKLIDFVHAF